MLYEVITRSTPIAPAPEAAPAPGMATGPSAGAREYGPIEKGETLSKIAMSVKPAGVTLEQMLVALYRANEDALPYFTVRNSSTFFCTSG